MELALPRFARTPMALAAASVFIASAAFAGGPAPFTIDSADTNQVGFYPFGPYPTVARSASGSFVVAWFPAVGEPSSAINLRLYAADGTPQGNIFNVSGDGAAVSVAMDKAGDFAVAWPSYTNGGIDSEVMIQRYAADGTAQGAAIDAGPDPTNYVGFAKIVASTPPLLAMDDDGDIAVAWTTETTRYWAPYGGYFFHNSIQWSTTYAAVYKTDGSTLAAKKPVEYVLPRTYPNGPIEPNADYLNGLAMDGSGNLVLSFNSRRGPTAQAAVLGLNKNLKIAHKFTDLPDVKNFTGLGIDSNGNFDIEWTDPTDKSLHVSQYNSSASLVDNVGPVETPDSNSALEVPTLSVAPSGSFVVTWGTANNFNYQKNGEYFNANGTPNGSPFVIDATPGNTNNWDAATAVDGNGNLVTIWSTMFSDGVTEALVGQFNSAP